jgi:thiamine biosynthesis lipoprotein
MSLDELKNQMPEYAKDIKLNLGMVLSADGAPGLTEEQIHGTALAAAIAGCGREAQTVSRQHLAFGTLVELSIYTDDASRANRAAEHLRVRLDDWHSRWHPWEGDGLASVNRQLAAGQPAAVEGQLTDMLRRAQALHTETDGLFDPAVGGLVRLWGFHDDESSPSQPPAEPDIERWLANRPKMADLQLSEGRVSAPGDQLQLDLGGFAKGYALDLAIAMLREDGIANAIVNAGGDLRVIGRHGERAWRVGIREPRGNGVFAAVEAADGEAVFTSGDYERYFHWQGRRYHHILDPRTGRPARGLQSVTVITDNAARADAMATALFVAGRQWPRLAREMGLRRVMAVTEDGHVELTETMAKRVQFIGEPPPRVETLTWQ